MTKKAIFASGCFWGTQHYLGKAKGVTKTTVGYTGGLIQLMSKFQKGIPDMLKQLKLNTIQPLYLMKSWLSYSLKRMIQVSLVDRVLILVRNMSQRFFIMMTKKKLQQKNLLNF